jgi:hypothetical protein
MGLVLVDTLVLPHVLRVSVGEETPYERKPIRNAMPATIILGSTGLSGVIEGWTDDLDERATILALNDEATHDLTIPILAAALPVLITHAASPDDADEFGRYPYSLLYKDAAGKP